METISSGGHVFKYILLKLAARCNINCKYCYWFRDESVYKNAKVLTLEAENEFVRKLRRHAETYNLDYFSILFHGGEPLLFGKKRFAAFCSKLRQLETDLGFELKLSMTTNGILIDEEWISLFRRYKILITISIDGPKDIHDQNRVHFDGAGTHEEVLRSIELLKSSSFDFGLLTVCNPQTDPERIVRFFVDELAWPYFDILVPDVTHHDRVQPIADYYIRLFDLWYDTYAKQDVSIRLFESMCKGLLGIPSGSESIGFGPNTTFTLTTDGNLEPLDVLRITSHYATRTHYTIFKNELQDIQNDAHWQEVRDACYNLHPTCESCEYKFACGGGHVAHRWSDTNRYRNPSVYCNDYKKIFRHIWSKMKQDLYYETASGNVPFESVDANHELCAY